MSTKSFLSVADRGSWAVLFVYCSSAGGIALSDDRWAARWIILCTALCAGVLFGVRTIVAGRNTSAHVTPAIAVNIVR